jgi:exodeoxyribonuclease-3
VKYSWWDQKTRSRERNIGWRIDYMFVSKSLEKHFKNADILDEMLGSDHAPVVVEI